MRRVECGEPIFTIAEEPWLLATTRGWTDAVRRKRTIGQTKDVLGRAVKLAEISTEKSQAAINESMERWLGRS